LAEINYAIAIELKAGDRGPTDGCESEDLATVFVPGEMFKPVVLLWVIEAGNRSSDWVKAVRMVIFQIVAALAGDGKVVEFVGTALGTWNDVFDR
jgi:hypothetical protein